MNLNSYYYKKVARPDNLGWGTQGLGISGRMISGRQNVGGKANFYIDSLLVGSDKLMFTSRRY